MSGKHVCIFCLSFLLGTACISHAELIAHWEFEGDLVDTVGGLEGTVVGDPQFAEGFFGQGLEYDGDDRVRVEDYHPVTGGDDRGITAWILPYEDMASNRGGIVSWGVNSSGRKWVIRLENLMLRCEINGGMIRADSAVMSANEWHHIGVVLANDGTPILGDVQLYVDGAPVSHAGHTKEIDTADTGFVEIGGDMESEGKVEFIGMIDDVRIFDHALTGKELSNVFRSTGPELAASPAPESGVSDVARDTRLIWEAGSLAATHDVYLGTVFEDVNDATVESDLLVSQAQDTTSFDPGTLDLGQTYYWRVDEVNGAPDNAVFKGEVWHFTVEPYSMLVTAVTATASSTSNDFSTPERTIDGSGLDANDMHTIGEETMWFSAAADLAPWIQYEFDSVTKLDIMKVWNSNSAAEAGIGWGIKDVEITYSVDGETWDVLADANQLSRAPGQPTYDQFDIIDFKGVAAKYVRLNIQSNWGGILMAYGLSEVQSFAIPAKARLPKPASGSVDILPDSTLTWRAGRDASAHTIYVSTDQNAVASGTAPPVVPSATGFDLSPLDLELDQTYYWRVDAVNDTEFPAVWAGPVWTFSTPAALIVDGFEGYANASPDRPFQTWIDGVGYSADEFFPVASEGNGTGAAIGHDVWTLTSPHYNGAIMETALAHGGSQSLPFYYANTGGAASETKRTFTVPQDWTTNAVQTLSLFFHGQPDNSGQLYVKINDNKVVYDGDTADIALAQWQPWNIDLTSIGGIQSVTTLSIGVDGASATGLLFIDDIGLYP